MSWLNFFKKNSPEIPQTVSKTEPVAPKVEPVVASVELVACCPYCKVQLEKFPARKKKCVSCGNSYYVRTDPDQHKKVVVTEQAAKEIDKRWEEINLVWEEAGIIKDFKDKLHYSVVKSSVVGTGVSAGISLMTPFIKRYIEKTGGQRRTDICFGMSEKEFNGLYEEMKASLREKFKFEPAEADVLWKLSNQLVTLASQKGDFNALQDLIYDEAYFLHMRGKDSLVLQAKVKELSVRSYQDAGIEKVQVATNPCCDECTKQDGKVITIKEAIAQKILPCKTCTNKLNPNAPTGYCFCSYLPFFEKK